MREIVVTGLGVATPAAVGAADFLTAQVEGRSGITEITRFDASGLPVRIAGEVTLPGELLLEPQERNKVDRVTQLAAAAARLAVADSGLEFDAVRPGSAGVVLGCGMGGAETMQDNFMAMHERGLAAVRSRVVPMSMANNAASWIAIHYGLTGPCTTVSTACASGGDALVTAHQMISSGEADIVLAGGAEAPLVSGVVSGFARLKALSRRNDTPAEASRPFSGDRDGFVIAEGAAVLVLESAEHAAARGARVLAEFAGYGRSCDAFHVTMPHPEATGAAAALEAALRSARLSPADVDHINAHGTATKFNDAAEATAIRTVFGTDAERIPITATKSITGHSLGAAGAIEAVAAVQAIMHDVVPPTVNLTGAEPGINVVGGSPLETKVAAALSNSFGFGGHNVVLAFTRA